VPNRFTIGLATVVMLVLLRLNIGWHFFSEGVKHWADPHWTSEPTLRAATGPLAPWYHAYLPDFHGLESALHADTSQSESHAVQGWIDAIGNDWDVDRQRFVEHYGLNEQQQKQARAVVNQYQQELRGWAAGYKDDLLRHVHDWRRMVAAKQAVSSDEVPFQKQRIAERRATLVGEASAWRGELTALEEQYRAALAGLLDADQRGRAPLPRARTSIDVVDGFMTYFILAVGALLLVGLFTRLTCVAGALFLLSVVMMQPFWVSEALPTYNQYVEMFALLALATVPVGRWAGLDYFVHRLLAGPSRETKGPCDALES
jgi:uncharacterized membrane protein YphA (DoxX/SURF4 family)